MYNQFLDFYRASWWKTLLARIFGKHVIAFSPNCKIHAHYFRKTYYVTREEHFNN